MPQPKTATVCPPALSAARWAAASMPRANPEMTFTPASLAEAGVNVSSGFARGIDAAAHRAALNAGGQTVAVFGCGIDVCYPPEQKGLLGALLASGVALSEFPMG